MTEVEAHRALSSKSRLQIMKLLYRKPLSVDQLAEKLGLQPITVRHHLQSLEEAGFIESYEERGGSVGRPKMYYKVIKEPPIISFPKRRYLRLSNFIISTLQFTLGAERSKKILRRVGLEMGENTIKRIESENNLRAWSLPLFERFFVREYLEKSGTEPEIVEVGDKKIVYRLHNCLFFELATRMPEMMCDVLHESFHEGISKTLGKHVKITRLTCMAKGDLYCEHMCEWKNMD
ncbi:MAG: helix-turn-helix transcriptional regulator [Candidatus Heimdallarchaeota archaeon]